MVQLSSNNVGGGSVPAYAGAPTTVSIDNVAGTVTIINAFVTSNVPSGNFSVATLAFTPIASGTVTLSTSGIVLTDQNGDDAPNTVTLSLSSTSLTIN